MSFSFLCYLLLLPCRLLRAVGGKENKSVANGVVAAPEMDVIRGHLRRISDLEDEVARLKRMQVMGHRSAR